MKLLFIGRFQPFHNKHLEILERLDKASVKVIIAVAAAQYSHIKENPFTYCEREHMIRLATHKSNLYTSFITIIPLPDIHDEKGWADYVQKVVGKFDAIVTNNIDTERLFEEKGYLIININMEDDGISGTFVRDEIARHTNLWEVAVPKPVINYIREIKGDERIRDLYKKEVKNGN